MSYFRAELRACTQRFEVVSRVENDFDFACLSCALITVAIAIVVSEMHGTQVKVMVS